MSEVFRNGELLAEAMLKAWREFGHDMILPKNGTACNAQACGVKVIYRDDAAPVAEKPLITKLDEAASLQVPDPYTTFPMCEILKATRILSKEIGGKVWICARADQGPMDLAAQLRGIGKPASVTVSNRKAELGAKSGEGWSWDKDKSVVVVTVEAKKIREAVRVVIQ